MMDRRIILLKFYQKFERVIKSYKTENLGKGRAVQKGIELSCGDLILIQDADLEYDPEDRCN